MTKIARSGSTTSGGLEAKKDGRAPWTLAENAEVGAGMRLVTDERTRARIDLDDGTVLLIDRSSDVSFDASPRSLHVNDGAVVADVAHIDGAPSARLSAPVGEVSVLGTKLALTATADRTSVEVMRGTIELRDGASGVVEVSAGQEGVAARGERLEVTPANDLAQRIAFSERLRTPAPCGPGCTAGMASHNEDADAPVSGLGELRARRPGKTDEKDHAVHLSSHAVKVRIVGNVARTEIDETFRNDTADDLEGIYRFPLPPAAEIERLALEVDGKLVDGAFVDKAKAAAIWRGAIQNAAPLAPKPQEEIVWVPGPWRDPALLEWQRGGRFELKIFPIPKRGARRIVIAYTETVAPVAGVRRYVYPLPQATSSDMKIDAFAFDVQVIGNDAKAGVQAKGYELTRGTDEGAASKLSQTLADFTPSGDLTIEYALADRATDATAWTYRDPKAPADDAFVAIALRPKLPRWSDVRPRDQVIVLDAGRAMFGERFARAARLAEQMTEEMDRRDRVTVLACDVTCRAMPGGWKAPGAGTAHDVDAFIATVTPDGASDLVGAVRAAAKLGEHDGKRDLRVVLVSDGAASAGYRRSERVAGEVRDALPDARAEIVAVPIGTDADVAMLEEVARGGGGVVVPYAPGEALETAALDVLNATYGTTLRDVELTLPDGLYDAAPGALAPMRAGGESIVAARLRGDQARGDVVLRGKVGGEVFEARYPVDVHATSDAGNAFVPRLYAAARIADKERDGAARAELVLLSQRFAVPCPFTSLLVLESEAMFKAFGIDDTTHATAWTGESAAIGGEVATLAKEESGTPGDLLGHDNESKLAGGGSGGGLSGFGSGRASAPRPSAPSGDSFDPFSASISTTPASPAPPPRPTATASAPPAAMKVAPRLDDSWRSSRRRGEWMRREWFRRASVSADATPAVSLAKIAAARAALEAAPDERARYKDLVRVLSVDGALDDLDETATRWSARDPLDADAIAARADVAARRGDRDAALRILSGIASATRALTPADAASMEAVLALDHERAGRDGRSATQPGQHLAEACAFRVAAAELRPDDRDAVARAVSCERSGGHGASADRWLASMKGDSARASVSSLAAKLDARGGASPSENVAFGDLVVDASWDASLDADLDIVIVDPAGNRMAWSGRSKNVRAADPTSTRHETLALSSSAAGPFSIELVRANATNGAGLVRGTLTVRSLGASMTRAFTLPGARVAVARVDVSWDSRLVPTDDTANCDPPFFFDARGQKRMKPECL